MRLLLFRNSKPIPEEYIVIVTDSRGQSEAMAESHAQGFRLVAKIVATITEGRLSEWPTDRPLVA